MKQGFALIVACLLIRAAATMLADSRCGNKSLKLIPHNPLRSAKAGSAYYTESA